MDSVFLRGGLLYSEKPCNPDKSKFWFIGAVVMSVITTGLIVFSALTKRAQCG